MMSGITSMMSGTTEELSGSARLCGAGAIIICIELLGAVAERNCVTSVAEKSGQGENAKRIGFQITNFLFTGLKKKARKY
jgi:hypothetical protein